jgi:hypothetical protein
MSDDNGGNFSGDGSVRWEIVSGDKIEASSGALKKALKTVTGPARVVQRQEPSGARCMGLDHRIGERFVVSVRPPTDMPAAQFIKKFVKVKNGRVHFELPIERVSKQIMIRWGKNPSGV